MEPPKEDFSVGPLSVLSDSVKKNCQVGSPPRFSGGRTRIVGKGDKGVGEAKTVPRRHRGVALGKRGRQFHGLVGREQHVVMKGGGCWWLHARSGRAGGSTISQPVGKEVGGRGGAEHALGQSGTPWGSTVPCAALRASGILPVRGSPPPQGALGAPSLASFGLGARAAALGTQAGAAAGAAPRAGLSWFLH